MSAFHTTVPRQTRRGAVGFLLLALVLVGGVSAAHEGLDEKIAAVTREIAARPRAAWLFARRADLHRLHGDPVPAWDDLRRASQLDPELVELPLVEARLLRDGGRPAKACAVLAALLEREPGQGRAHALHAELLVATGRPRLAVQAYDRALACSAPTPDLHLARARAAASLGPEALREALRGLDAGLEQLGQVPALVLEAVALERRRGNTDAALGRIRGASASLAPHVAARLEGDVLLDAGRRDEARPAYEAALAAVGRLSPEKRRTPATRELVTAVRRALAEHFPETDSPR